MERKWILLIFVVLIQTNYFAQNNVKDNKLCTYIVPLSLIDFWAGASIRPGGEFKITDNYAMYSDFGLYFYNQNAIKSHVKGLTSHTGFKYYLNKDKVSVGEYFAIEYQFKHQSFNLEDSFIVAPLPAYKKEYRMVRNVNSLMVKFGNTNVRSNRFFFDWYVGLGVRFENSHSNLSDMERSAIKKDLEGFIWTFTRAIGRNNLPFYNMGFKIGYTIN